METAVINTSAWKMVADIDYNVQLQSENAYRNQIWYFERKDDLYYKITNVKTGYCLDVYDAGNTNGTNIAIWENNDSDAQRWCFTEHEGKYVLHPKCAVNMALDVNGASTNDGANVQLWETNGTSAQDFTIWKFDNTPNKPTVTSDKGMYPTGSNVKIYWGENDFATSYIVDVWYNNGISGEHIEHFNTTNIECTINNCQSGKYGVFVTSVNTNGNVISDVYNFFVSKDIGNEFYASIIRNDDWLSLQDIDGNAVVSSGSPSLNEVWYFTKADNECGYFIKNCKTEKYLDLDVSKDENGHNVKTWDYNGSNAQIWYVLGQSSGTYTLKPKCTQNRVLDIDRDSSNAQIWDLEYNNNQKLAIWIYDTFEVIYNLNGGTEVIENQTKVNAHDLAITDVKPTRVDYEFLGWSRDNNATIAEYLPGATFSENKNTTLYAVWRELKLENISTLSAETIKLGETITATGSATGGTGSYQYNILYKQTAQTKWTTVQSYKANATVTIKPTKATTYDVCVKVKDSNGTEVKKYFTVKVTDVLKNNSTLSKTEITLGDTITVNGKATGGSSSYQYNILYKQTAQSKWTTVQSYKANATVTIKPTKATTYDVCVKVKDGNGTEVKEYFTVNVTNNELKNISTISAETINLGESVTVNAKATGSTGFYTYAVYYKKTSDTKWTTAQDFKANNKVAVTPTKATTYDICVKVKDDKGTIDKKYFTVNVTSNELKNISTVSAETINIGESVTVNANATGSTGFYTYAVYYKQEAQTKWTTVQDFKANNKVTVKPTKATTYDICVKVKDDKGTVDKKYFKVNVTDFANTSAVSATEITLGQTIEVNCSATGSTGFYQYAVYYKKTADTKWTMKQNYSSNNSVTFKPTEATTYDICVKVKDNQDNIVKRYFEVTVK